MFFIFYRLFHKVDMGIMRCCDINYIDIGVGEHIVKVIVHLFYSVFFGKSNSLFVRSVSDCIKSSAVFCHSRSRLVCDNSRTQNSPIIFFHFTHRQIYFSISFPSKLSEQIPILFEAQSKLRTQCSISFHLI